MMQLDIDIEMGLLQILLWWPAAVGHRCSWWTRYMWRMWRTSRVWNAVDASSPLLFAAGLQRPPPFNIWTWWLGVVNTCCLLLCSGTLQFSKCIFSGRFYLHKCAVYDLMNWVNFEFFRSCGFELIRKPTFLVYLNFCWSYGLITSHCTLHFRKCDPKSGKLGDPNIDRLVGDRAAYKGLQNVPW